METRPESSRRRRSRWALAALFLTTGVLHFTNTDAYRAAMPPGLPSPRALILVSGLFEILGGLGVLVPDRRVRRAAGWGLAALLVAVFPANVHMALAGVGASGVFGRALLWLRLPLQPLIVWWALRASGAIGRRRGRPATSP